ncbi:MAG: amidase [Gammaproteobacteria bacterium]|nr:amidase [Gammaproteobacteria bacterium]
MGRERAADAITRQNSNAMSHAPADAVFVQTMQLGGDGLRVGVKDSIDIAGYATRSGSIAFAAAPPAARHAAVVQALLDGGCRIVGKTNMHELAYGVTGINRATGTPRNPRYPDRIPGGSSSGSAVAVAAELVDFALGTDTGGSIRIPAACCGIYGIKPTYGRVSRDGVHPLDSTLDCVGPFARDLTMIERAMALIDSSFVPVPPPTTVRVGWVDVIAAPAVGTAVRSVLDDANVTVTQHRLPLFEEAFGAGLTIIGAENWAAFGHLTDSDAPGTALGADVRARLLAARGITREALAAAEKCRENFRAEVDALLERVDVLALPTLPDFPLTLEAAADAHAAVRTTAFVRPFNLSGHPALTIPLETPARLPAGLQLVGRRGADAALCALAHRIVGRSAPLRDAGVH